MPSQKGTKQQGKSASTPKKDGKTTCSTCSTVLDNGKTRSIACDVCDSWFCIKCSKLKSSIFDEIAAYSSILWTCSHCNIPLPGLKKVLSALTKFEERVEKIEKAIENLQNVRQTDMGDMNNNQPVNPEYVQDAVRDVLEEEKEKEKRKLNIIMHELPESTGDSIE